MSSHAEHVEGFASFTSMVGSHVSTLLQSRRETFQWATVPLSCMGGDDATVLLNESVPEKAPFPGANDLSAVDREEVYVKPMIVITAAVARFGKETGLLQLSNWLKKLAADYPKFTRAIDMVQGTANIWVAKQMNWSPADFELLAQELQDKSPDSPQNPLRDRVDSYVTLHLNELFKMNG